MSQKCQHYGILFLYFEMSVTNADMTSIGLMIPEIAFDILKF